MSYFIVNNSQRRGVTSARQGTDGRNVIGAVRGIPPSKRLREDTRSTEQNQHVIIGNSSASGITFVGQLTPDANASTVNTEDGETLLEPSERQFPICFNVLGTPTICGPISIPSIRGNVGLNGDLRLNGDLILSDGNAAISETFIDFSNEVELIDANGIFFTKNDNETKAYWYRQGSLCFVFIKIRFTSRAGATGDMLVRGIPNPPLVDIPGRFARFHCDTVFPANVGCNTLIDIVPTVNGDHMLYEEVPHLGVRDPLIATIWSNSGIFYSQFQYIAE